jgi:acetyltransferase
MSLAVRYGNAEGYRSIVGEVLAENRTMLQLCRELGFEITSREDGIQRLRLALPAEPTRRPLDPGHGPEPVTP